MEISQVILPHGYAKHDLVNGEGIACRVYTTEALTGCKREASISFDVVLVAIP